MAAHKGDDPFLQRLQAQSDARNRIAKLLALAHKHPDTPEGQSARRKATELASRHGIEMEGISIAKPKKVDLRFMSGMAKAMAKAYPGKIDAGDLIDKNRRPKRDLDEGPGDDDTY